MSRSLPDVSQSRETLSKLTSCKRSKFIAPKAVPSGVVFPPQITGPEKYAKINHIRADRTSIR